jgi:hypothetical protein
MEQNNNKWEGSEVNCLTMEKKKKNSRKYRKLIVVR